MNGEKEKFINGMWQVKPVYIDHPWDPKFVAFIDRWSLFRDSRQTENGTLRGRSL